MTTSTVSTGRTFGPCHVIASPERFVIQTADARHLPFPDGAFDKAFAISVLEHIEGDGDAAAIRDMGRVFKPGGTCVVTVPLGRTYLELFTTRESYYIKPEAGRPAFYERHYDEGALARRLIEPSGLRVLSVEYLAERGFSYERWYARRSRWLKVSAAALSPVATRLFIEQTPAFPSSRGTATAVLTLGKQGPLTEPTARRGSAAVTAAGRPSPCPSGAPQWPLRPR